MQDARKPMRDTPSHSFALSDRSATFGSMQSTEWDVRDYNRLYLRADIEILMHHNGEHALIAYPWWVNPEKINDAVLTAQAMGFQNITEVGNLTDYKIPEVRCSDWDYLIMETERNEQTTST